MKNTQKYMEGMKDREKQVFKVLICPIESRKSSNKIEYDSKNKIIISSQQYKRSEDEDMSDLAVRFYEIIYDFAKNPFLNNGDLFCKEFAGDTMNSYNTVTKFSSEKKKIEFSKAYHCLANFWVLPFEIGRKTNSKSKSSGGRQINTAQSFNKGRRDYMDRFLKYLYKNKEDYKNEYCRYFGKISFDDFGLKHFLIDSYVNDNKIKEFSYVKEEGLLKDNIDGVIDKMYENICIRARNIAMSEKSDKLWEEFNKLNLY